MQKKGLRGITSVFKNTDARTLLLRKNIIANFLLKACSGIITLMLVPLTLACLGEYSNGVWLTISSALLLVDNLDIGLGNGLRNKLTELVASEKWNEAKVAVSSTFVLLIAIILPVMTLLIIVIDTSDMYSILNIQQKSLPGLDKVLVVCVVLFCSTFIMKFIGNIYLGMQLPAVSNFLATGGHPLILLGTYFMYANGVHSLMWIAVLNMSVPLLMYALAYPYTFYVKYTYMRPSILSFSWTMARGLFSTGILFFLNQVASAVVLFSSNILISRWFDPSMVTPYQIAYRYFSVPFLVFTVINAPNWSATADAYQRKDMEWIRRSVRRMNRVLFIFLLAIIVMVLLSKTIYAFWIGGNVEISTLMTICVGIYMYVMMVSLAYCYYLNGVGALKLQLRCMFLGVAIYFAAACVLLLLTDNVVSIPIAMAMSLMPNAICNRMQFMKILNNNARGIWRE